MNSIAYLQVNDTLPIQKYYYNSGKISSKGMLENGLPSGIWRNYYESGTLRSEGEKKAGKSNGTWTFYSPDGIKEKQISYSENLKNGSYQQFDSTGKLAEEKWYENDTLQQVSRTYKNGKLKTESNYSGGKKNGLEKTYSDSDGRVIETIYYNDDAVESRMILNQLDNKNQKTGLWRTFYPDGRLKLECLYENDKVIGNCKEWNEKGSLLIPANKTGEFKEMPEVRQTFHPNGKLASFMSYAGKFRQGVSSEYDSAGVLLVSYLYQMDTLLAKGFILSSGVNDSNWVYYYPGLQKSAEGKYKKGLKTGTWTYYNTKGKVIQKGPFRRGIIDGDWVWYYSNGQVKKNESYIGGKREGLSVEFDSLGNKITEGMYVNDLRNGDWFYNVNGLMEKGAYSMGLKTGDWKHYCIDPDKNLCFKGTFKDDVPVGWHYYYHSNGKMKIFGKYKKGSRQGEWKEYDNKGTLLHNYYYKKGVLISIDGDRTIRNAE